ncbi:hypothetical protein NDU88_001096 [Pleurodeles waltl]|uniref:Uncharacterized protein n=1 Tax=Pleurodeles waltl TaxID=8319 RepID=A0AAV7NJ41_PLEWA|nr:hypothetical protein NDU88_001096 [Pleurodeles waltl]
MDSRDRRPRQLPGLPRLTGFNLVVAVICLTGRESEGSHGPLPAEVSVRRRGALGAEAVPELRAPSPEC